MQHNRGREAGLIARQQPSVRTAYRREYPKARGSPSSARWRPKISVGERQAIEAALFLVRAKRSNLSNLGGNQMKLPREAR